MNEILTQKEIIQQKIAHIKAKPKEFSPEQKKKKEILENLLISLENKLKEIDEEEQNSAKAEPILKKLVEINTQLNKLQSEIFSAADQRLLKQYESILNPQPLSQAQKKEMEDEEEFKEEIILEEQGIITWEEYKKSLGDLRKITTLKIPRQVILKTESETIEAGSAIQFENNKLSITKEEFPNLKTLYACGLELEEVELDHDGLNNLYLTNNKLPSIDVSKTPNLVDLYINNNEIDTITGLENLTKLEDFRCNNNQLEELDVSNLTSLEIFDGSHNSFSEVIKFGNNPSLWSIDLAENNIDFFNFPHLPSLLMLSLRETATNRPMDASFLEEIGEEPGSLTLRFPKLIFLDYHRSDISKLVFDPEYPLENPNKLYICNERSYTDSDGNYNPDIATAWEHLFNQIFLLRKAKKQSLFPEIIEEESNNASSITDPSQLTNNYSNFCEKNKDKEFLDISHMKLTGTFIIDGWTNLKEFNVGNNFLSYLVVKNCPNLTTLRYAHNAMKHDAFIDWKSCPNLKNIDKEKYNDTSWDKDLEKLFKEDKLESKLDNNPQPSQPKEPIKEENYPETPNKNKPITVNYFPFYLIFVLAFIGIGFWLFKLSKKKKQ